MRRNMHILLIIFLGLFIFLGPGVCHAQNGIGFRGPGDSDSGDSDDSELYEKDYLQVQTLDDKVVVFRNKKPSPPVNLEVGEQVFTIREDGHMAAVVTDRRFLAISSASESWLSEPFESGEADSATLEMGEAVVILVTDERLLGFGGKENRFAEVAFGIGENVLAEDAGQNFGVVVTSDRAIGFASKTGNYTEIAFGVGDTFHSLEMAATLALVHTDDNIYVYRASTGAWSIREQPLAE